MPPEHLYLCWSPYVHNFIMHRGSPHMHFFAFLPVCIWGVPACVRGPNSDVWAIFPWVTRWTRTGIKTPCMRTGDPHAHMESHLDPRMHTGIAKKRIPICIQRFAWCTYAYGDNSVTTRMHMGNISIWKMKSCIPLCNFFHLGCIRRSQYAYGWSQYAYGQGSLKICILGLPVCIIKLCTYGDLLHPFPRIWVIYNQNPVMHNRWEWVIYNRRKTMLKIFPPFLFLASFLL